MASPPECKYRHIGADGLIHTNGNSTQCKFPSLLREEKYQESFEIPACDFCNTNKQNITYRKNKHWGNDIKQRSSPRATTPPGKHTRGVSHNMSLA